MVKRGKVRILTRPQRILRRVVRIIVTLLAAALLAAGGYLAYLSVVANNALSGVKRAELIPVNPSRTTPVTVTPLGDPYEGRPVNVLLLGSDTRGQDQGRSDSIILAHLPSDRKSAYLLSLPRDLYVSIPGHGRNKINAAYSLGGAQLTVQTVEGLLGITVDHAAVVDFRGFNDLIDVVGGVTIDNPYEGCDTGLKICWKKGEIELTRENALKYVRWRHGLPEGDITRAKNQQRVLKAIAGKVLSAGTLADPSKLSGVISGVTSIVTVDQGMTDDIIRGLALNLRLTGTGSIRSLVFPMAGFNPRSEVGWVDLVDEERAEELKSALGSDSLEGYWREHKDEPAVKNG